MHLRRPPRTLVLLGALSLWLPAACGPDEAGAAAPAGPVAGRGPARLPRAADEGARELRRLLDLGHLAQARPLLAARSGELGVEGELLAARAAQLAGDDVEAGRRLEAARAAAPRSPEVYAVAAELHAAAGRLETARRELRAGLELSGAPTPELLRAQAVLFLAGPGGAARGLELLERARREDPELPFCDRALAQALLLLAKEALRAGDAAASLLAVRRSLEHDPEEVEARRLLSDVLAAQRRLEEALAVLEELAAEGHPVGAELSLMQKRAAMGALLRRDRPRALELFARARAGSLTEEDLGIGARLLAEAAVAEYERAQGLLAEGRAEEGTAALETAVFYEPDYLAARYHLGVLRFQAGDPAAAATHFARVVERAHLDGIELPDPAHISLHHALRAADRPADARAALELYLERTPTGRYAEATRALLEAR